MVEIDGLQHEEAVSVGAERDALLAALGFETIRIPAHEMRALAGPGLDAVRQRAGGLASQPAPTREAALLTQAPALVHRAVLGLVEARTAGLLGGDDWIVEIDDPLDIAARLISPYLDLMLAADILASAGVMPSLIEIRAAGRTVAYTRRGSKYEIVPPGQPTDPPDVLIALEPDRSPLDTLEPADDVPTIIVRSAFIPVRIADPFLQGSERPTITASPTDCADALLVLLQGVFAKENFRDGQLPALQRVIEGENCAVLLPTGAGKSLIYQLAGLVLPGRTIIIDPIVALMEDQVRGLRANGIDRVIDVSSASVRDLGAARVMEIVASGDALFVFLAPERLQQAGFREALRSLAQRTIVNIAVVDEAHCVSEWGHDFRTAYLNLGRILREHLSSGSLDPGPPVLALTGTASRAVLRDVLVELEIDPQGGDAIIQPNSFDRPELHYRIRSEEPRNAVAALTGAIAALPGDFGLPDSSFFRPRADQTMSGLVFCPHTNGTYGVKDVAQELENALQIDVLFYSGGSPRGID
ncbi:MAG: DEAD/DEAH box helicase, partial [Burkholderiales bacterium]